MKGEHLIYETCGVCECKRPQGIHLYNMFICRSCEQRMIHTAPEDEDYAFYIRKLKNITQTKQYS